MNRLFTASVVAVGLLAFLVPARGRADDNDSNGHLQATLSGFNELLGPNLGIGAIFSTGSGRIKLRIDQEDREIRFTLTYAFPDATAPAGTQFVNQAHLHFGQNHTTGGITVWLCDSADSPAPGTVTADTCPDPSGTVNGTIRPSDILALGGQGLPGGEDGFDALLKALRTGAIYANVHTDRFPGGEIRGQLGASSAD